MRLSLWRVISELPETRASLLHVLLKKQDVFMLLTWIVGFSLIGSIGAIILAGAYLLFPEGIRQILILCLISYATGTLLGAAFLGLLQHALEHAPAASILSTVLVGILAFFLLEKIGTVQEKALAPLQIYSGVGSL